MKTRILHYLTVASVLATMSATAFAGQSFPRLTKERSFSKPAPTRTLPQICQGKSCCGTALVPVGPRPRNWSELIRTCKSHCPVPDANRAAQCGKGGRA
jgi:hypothetical protein